MQLHEPPASEMEDERVKEMPMQRMAEMCEKRLCWENLKH